MSAYAVPKNAFQELDHLNMFAPVAKWVRRIDRADRLEDYVDMAFTAASSGRQGCQDHQSRDAHAGPPRRFGLLRW